jgi:glycine cleavage system aminomethyltransferase T
VPAQTGAAVQVEVRARALPARVVRVPFVRHGEPLVAIDP